MRVIAAIGVIGALMMMGGLVATLLIPSFASKLTMIIGIALIMFFNYNYRE